MRRNILIVGNDDKFGLENSYKKALTEEGCEVSIFNINKSITSRFPFSRISYRFSINDTQTISATNIKLAKKIFNEKPDEVWVFCNAMVSTGLLAFLNTIKIKTVLIWPDAITNLNQLFITNLKLYNFVASYSHESISVFEKLGASNTVWIPLAGDKYMHYQALDASFSHASFDNDLCFIGGWRPERESILSFIVDNFPNLRVQIFGTDWEKASNSKLTKSLNKHPLRGKDFSDAIRKSKINLNVIDDTNFPAANMRFFEILIAGGLQLTNACPEMENIFLDNVHLYYFKDKGFLADKINSIQAMSLEDILKLKKNAQDLICSAHTYNHRVNAVLNF